MLNVSSFPHKITLTFQDSGGLYFFGQTHSVNKKEQQKLLCTETRIFNKTLRFSGNQISCVKNQTFRLRKLYEILEKLLENLL